jgi:hypothetical protein
MRTIVFVYGYNLYYGLLRKSPYKWLDLFSLFKNHVLDHTADVIEVRYYTAPVKEQMSDDPNSPQRQRIYFQALRKMPPCKVTIIEGRMEASKPYRRLVNPIPGVPDKVQIWNFTEKKTDVNLATDMLSAAWSGSCEQVVLCSNDTDLEGALASIRTYLPQIKIGLVAPIPKGDHRKISNDLEQYAHWSKRLSEVHLQNAQLPFQIPVHSKPIKKPESW